MSDLFTLDELWELCGRKPFRARTPQANLYFPDISRAETLDALAAGIYLERSEDKEVYYAPALDIYFKPHTAGWEHVLAEKNIIIVDLDGTVRNGEHREHFIRGGEKKWDEYFMACGQDLPILPVIKCIQSMALMRRGDIYPHEGDLGTHAYGIVIMSGCGEMARDITWDWIGRHLLAPVRVSALFMRPKGDFRPDFQLKKEWAQQIGIDRILMAFEDRNGVVEMWRSLGIQCLQVAPGDF